MWTRTPVLLCLAVFAGLLGLIGAVHGLVPAREVAAAGNESTPDPVAQTGGFAVVELFTSQGCSSCPPADDVLSSLHEQSERGEPVYCLSFHVDYWNRLGWADPFSTAEATRRQNSYSRLWKLGRVYTPQMVVNGSSEFVGSDQKKALRAVAAALDTPAAQSLRLKIAPPGSGAVEVSFEASAKAEHLVATLALVQRTGGNSVPRGENEGRRLTHVGIVRSFQTKSVELQTTGRVSLDVPSDVDATSLEVVGFLQQLDTGVIVAASRAPL